MVEQAEREPTIAEIAVALRETRQSLGRTPHLAVIDGRQPGANEGGSTAPRIVEGLRATGRYASADAQIELGTADIGDLRDDEIERLLTENARLNERIVFLLKTIEGVQARDTELAVGRDAMATERDAILRGLKAAIEAELRPFLAVVLHLLERQRGNPNGLAEASVAARPTRNSQSAERHRGAEENSWCGARSGAASEAPAASSHS